MVQRPPDNGWPRVEAWRFDGLRAPSAMHPSVAPREAIAPEFQLERIVGESDAIRAALEQARRAITARLTTVLIVGETGSGKELFARGIHYGGSTRAEPFVAVNCAAIPEALLETELFGQERGAGSGAEHGGGAPKPGLMEMAGAGTLFLDEIGELPTRLQPRLLRAIEERRVRRVGGADDIPIHCRLIAAAGVALHDAVSRLEFREDLYYRLNTFRIDVPPLRERAGDVEIIARHVLRDIARQQNLEPKRLDAGALAALRAHRWPGNVRELKNVIEHAAILSEGPAIGANHLMIQHRTTTPAVRPPAGAHSIQIPAEGRPLDGIVLDAVRITLEITRGNRSAAARVLGISRPTLARRLRELARRREREADSQIVR